MIAVARPALAWYHINNVSLSMDRSHCLLHHQRYTNNDLPPNNIRSHRALNLGVYHRECSSLATIASQHKSLWKLVSNSQVTNIYRRKRRSIIDSRGAVQPVRALMRTGHPLLHSAPNPGHRRWRLHLAMATIGQFFRPTATISEGECESV